MRKLWVLFAALALSGCGYNQIQQKDEGIKAAWSEVINQYQRRADLIPNLVATVKGYAQQEQEVLTRRDRGARQGGPDAGHARDSSTIRPRCSASSRRRATSSSALSRLLVVVGELSGPQVRRRTSATCRRSSKAPRTASPWRATATSRRCRTTT